MLRRASRAAAASDASSVSKVPRPSKAAGPTAVPEASVLARVAILQLRVSYAPPMTPQSREKGENGPNICGINGV